jgi:hypothetical protein
MISESFVVLSAIWALVIVVVFTGLAWAAIQDGRDERRFRARRVSARPESAASPRRRP